MGSCLSVQGHNDADEYHKLMEAMKTLGFKDVELRETFKLLAALLQDKVDTFTYQSYNKSAFAWLQLKT